MNAKMRTFLFTAVLSAMFIFLALSAPASAKHSWNGYHCARSASKERNCPNLMPLGSSPGETSAKSYRPTLGRVEVCNANYRNTGWLGIAQTWLSGGPIAQGTVKNNDYYLGNSTYAYNNRAQMQRVICQEIGHAFGLDHQDESGISLNTRMDYYHHTSASHDQAGRLTPRARIPTHKIMMNWRRSMPISIAGTGVGRAWFDSVKEQE